MSLLLFFRLNSSSCLAAIALLLPSLLFLGFPKEAEGAAFTANSHSNRNTFPLAQPSLPQPQPGFALRHQQQQHPRHALVSLFMATQEETSATSGENATKNGAADSSTSPSPSSTAAKFPPRPPKLPPKPPKTPPSMFLDLSPEELQELEKEVETESEADDEKVITEKASEMSSTEEKQEAAPVLDINPEKQEKEESVAKAEDSLEKGESNVNGDAGTTGTAKRSQSKSESYITGMSLQSTSMQEQYDALLEEMWNKEAILQELRQNTSKLESILTEKDSQLEQVEQGKKTLQEKIAAFAQQLTQVKNEEETAEQEHKALVKDYQDKERDLSYKVGLLQKDMVNITNQLRTEQNRYLQLEQRIEEVQGTQEWEEEQFRVEKEQLLAEVQEQQEKLKNITAQRNQEQKVFASEQEKLQAKVNASEFQVNDALSELNGTREDYNERRMKLEKQIRDEEEAIRTTKDQLQTTKTENANALKALQDMLQSSRDQFAQLQETLKNQSLSFIDLESDLESKIQQSNKTKEQLMSRLQNEQTRYDFETEFMQQRLEAESKRLESVQEQLESETRKRQEISQKWKDERSRIEDQQRTAARIMNQRFSQLRAALHEQWRVSKQQGRRMELELTSKYESDVQEMEEALKSLQGALSISLQSRKQLQKQYDEEILQTTKLQDTKREIEDDMIKSLREIDMELNHLKQDEANLEGALEEKTHAIDTLETDYQSIRKAIWGLTKRRVRNTRQRILRKLSRKNGDDQ